jgi:hypothetical protein
MAEEQRKRMRDMRLDAARRGIRVPKPANCAWLDSVVRAE